MHTFKVLISIILLLGIIITSGLITYNILEASSTKIEKQLIEVEKYTFSGDWAKAEKYMDSINSNWEKTSKIWSSLIDHIEIDNIDASLAKAEKYIILKDTPLALAEISTLKLFVRHIPEKENFNLKNIL